jgi:hypothetical protein
MYCGLISLNGSDPFAKMAGIIYSIGFVFELENIWSKSTSHGLNHSGLVYSPWWTECTYPFAGSNQSHRLLVEMLR